MPALLPGHGPASGSHRHEVLEPEVQPRRAGYEIASPKSYDIETKVSGTGSKELTPRFQTLKSLRL